MSSICLSALDFLGIEHWALSVEMIEGFGSAESLSSLISVLSA